MERKNKQNQSKLIHCITLSNKNTLHLGLSQPLISAKRTIFKEIAKRISAGSQGNQSFPSDNKHPHSYIIMKIGIIKHTREVPLLFWKLLFQ